MLNKILEDVLSKTEMKDKQFIRTMVLFKMAQIATNMRARIIYMDGTAVPMNFYGIALATSGANKNRTMNYLDRYFKGFEKEFMSSYAPVKSIESMDLMADRISIQKGIDKNEAEHEIHKEWKRLPKHLYSFSDATIEGAKAFRQKLTMAEIGSLNLEVDEIASNLERIYEVLTLFLETYDMGYAKSKLIKVDSNTAAGQVDSNMLVFGTPARLLNGSSTEGIFFDLLEEGYARRLIYAYADETFEEQDTIEEAYQALLNSEKNEETNELSEYIKELCSNEHFNVDIAIPEEPAKMLLAYKIECESEARKMPSIAEMEKAELAHRYWRALKIAGIITFFNKEKNVTIDTINEAINIAEVSGEAFKKIVNRPPNYKRLFDYLVDVDKKVTQTELIENLFFYNKAPIHSKKDMVNMAKAYAYTEGGIVKEVFKDGIQFLSGEKLNDASLDAVILSVSPDLAHNYEPLTGKWDNLPNVLRSGLHWCPRHFKDKHRSLDNSQPSFNLIVLDVDEGVSMDFAMEIMSEYKYIVAPTTNHQKEKNGVICDRFRMVLILDKELNLSNSDFTQFMLNIREWLPFDVDTSCFEAARKYVTVKDGDVFTNDGDRISALDFVPDTIRQTAMTKNITDIGDVSALQRWFLLKASVGNRNQHLIRMAFMLLDSGNDYEEVEDIIVQTNDKLHEPLPAREIQATIMKTARKRIRNKEDGTE